MVTSENVMHFPSENRAFVPVGYIPVGTSYKQKWYTCMSHLVNRVGLSEVEVWVYLCCMFVIQICLGLLSATQTCGKSAVSC
jgi:hypothetical protein